MADYVDPVEIDPHQVVFVTKANPERAFKPGPDALTNPMYGPGRASKRAAEIEAGLAAGNYADIESEVRAELAELRRTEVLTPETVQKVRADIEGDPGTLAPVPQWLREWRGSESLPAEQVRRDIEEFEVMRDKARRYDEIRNVALGTLDDASKLGWIQGVLDR